MTVSAGLGLANFPFDGARQFWRWVDLCDGGGVDSLWQSDRLIGRDPNLECLSLMAALAGATRRIKFGMNVASLGLRDPVITAKACATIDVLSEGRLLPAFGVGSALYHMEAGRPRSGRLAQLVRAPASHAGGHWFESSTAHQRAAPVLACQGRSGGIGRRATFRA